MSYHEFGFFRGDMKSKFIYCIHWIIIITSYLATSELSAQLAPDLEKGLAAGDASAIAKIQNSTLLDELLNVLILSLRKQFGTNSNLIKEAAIIAIKRIPDHAKTLGDEIEKLSTMPGTGRSRDRKFYLLQEIGSPEAVIEIGRFLLDDKNPGANLPVDDGSFEVANSYMAANAIGHVLRNEMKLKRKPGFYGLEEVAAWQAWWKSSNAKIYKNLSPSQAPNTNATPHVKAKSAAKKQALAKKPTESESWQIGSVILGSGAALAFLLWQQKKDT